MRKIAVSLFLGVLLFVVAVAPCHAQATRTWVSGVGSDANPCSRTAPCITLAGAISKTAAGGEISVLDPGGIGAVTITKSISIVSEGSEGSILGCSTSGITINAAATDVVSIHGVFFEGCGNGLNGIKVISAKEVHIRKCLIRNFKSASGTGILVAPTSAGVNVNVFVSECTIASNARGIATAPTAGTATTFLDRVVVEDSGLAGILSAGANATTYLSNSVVGKNLLGLKVTGGGSIISFGNNTIGNNTTDGAPTSTLTLK
ncbi:MAG TPA: hypothetical protein VHV99_10155 [Paraburkholderia sp.]|jgi:hypothetical protein|nr:hypothetical protein [Paraburkholderia sp.]